MPVADATGFDAGTGRVDAMDAIEQDVLAPASLSLGSYAWPYSDLQPTSTSLTYTNTGAAPVTLSLALTGQDGSAEPTGSMTLASDTVTVPAGETSSVEVLLDPTIADPGSYSAVVTATPDDGGGTVRTGLAYLLEPERYDVTVTVKPRVGTQSASHELGLSSFGEPWIYEQRSFGAAPGAQTATFRLPPGTYTTGAISFGLADDGAKEGIVSYEPSFTVSKDTEIVLDENQTGRFGYQVDRPVVDDGAILDVGWTTDAGYNGLLFYGAVDRLYGRPSAGLGGSANVAANWLLSQPEGLLTPPGRKPVALRPVPAAGTTPAEHSGRRDRRTVPDRRRRQRGLAAHVLAQGRRGRGLRDLHRPDRDRPDAREGRRGGDGGLCRPRSRVRGNDRRIRRPAHAAGQAVGRQGAPGPAAVGGPSSSRTSRRRTCTTW